MNNDYWPTPREKFLCMYPKPMISDTDMIMQLMEKNIGKNVMFQVEDGSQFYGKISSVPNSEHYCIIIDRNGTPWEWYARKESIHFVIKLTQK